MKYWSNGVFSNKARKQLLKGLWQHSDASPFRAPNRPFQPHVGETTVTPLRHLCHRPARFRRARRCGDFASPIAPRGFQNGPSWARLGLRADAFSGGPVLPTPIQVRFSHRRARGARRAARATPRCRSRELTTSVPRRLLRRAGQVGPGTCTYYTPRGAAGATSRTPARRRCYRGRPSRSSVRTRSVPLWRGAARTKSTDHPSALPRPRRPRARACRNPLQHARRAGQDRPDFMIRTLRLPANGEHGCGGPARR